MWSEFKAFIAKGNVMDLAVGIIIGGAFTLIVNSLVEDIVMPIVGLFGEADFSNYFVALDGQEAATLAAAREAGGVFAYGSFVTTVINFLILAFIVFLLVRYVNKLRAQFDTPEDPKPDAPPPADVQVLQEIRDLLRERSV